VAKASALEKHSAGINNLAKRFRSVVGKPICNSFASVLTNM
jgi:hypothetical protein